MVNALPHNLLRRAIAFKQCPDESMSPPTLLQVTLSPEVPVAGQKDKVTISGKFARDITESTEITIEFYDNGQNHPAKFPACTGSGCSIKAGDQYTKTVEIQAPGSIPQLSFMIIYIGNPNTNFIGCAYAKL